MGEYFILLFIMALFTTITIWFRAVWSVWNKAVFSWRVFGYENFHRITLAYGGDVLFSLAYFLAPDAVQSVLGYLGFAWAASAGAVGFVVGLITLFFTSAVKHPLREG